MLVIYRRLLEAAEKLKWPLKVDYTAATSEDRRAFETSFGHLLKLQKMYARTLLPFVCA